MDDEEKYDFFDIGQRYAESSKEELKNEADN